ncbi:MAG: ABC transporter permease [Candidatus Helarchaeota archaeon]|nr:ABC transporter permease [Candidatus Helarchaeota archaeon]
MSYFKEMLAVFQRGLVVLWRNKILLFGNLIMPFAIIIILGPAAHAQSVGDLSFKDLATGIMCMMIFFSGMFIPNNLIWDRESGFLNIMFVSPCHRSSIILGYSLVGAVRSTLQVVIIYIGAVLVGNSLGYNIPFGFDILILLILLTILMTIFVGGFMTIIASFSKNSETFFLLAGMIGMPLIFLSNVFFKPENLPFGLGALGVVNPINYLVNLVRYIILDEIPPEGPLLGLLILITTAILFTLLGTYSFVRSAKK